MSIVRPLLIHGVDRETAAFYIGFDPGGNEAFGWAVLRTQGTITELVKSGTCSDAHAASEAAKIFATSAPIAIAIDAPLFWVNAGDRKADARVRKMVCAAGGSSGTVSHVNSLRGACLAQGILVTKIAVESWPNALVTEAHPKALLRVSPATRQFAGSLSKQTANEHERDAAIAAYTACAFAEQREGWHDLSLLETNPFFPAGKSAVYWFPKGN
jgi:predicted nuclease with RNAse H fold